MKTTFFSSFVFYVLTFGTAFAQGTHSIQVNGGLIMPMHSSEGLIGTAQYNYKLNSRFEFYAYGGYAAWDQFKSHYHVVDWTSQQKIQDFYSYSEDEHIMIPFYAGTKINFHSTSWLTSYVSLELGYSYLSYNKYTNYVVMDDEGTVTGYAAYGPIGKESENLFGTAISGGISHPLTKNVSLIFYYKLHSFFNMKDNPFFSTKATYSLFSAGFDFNI